MICPNCSRPMKNIMHYEKEKCYQFNLCKHCLKRTKNKRIHYEDIPEKNNLNTTKLNKGEQMTNVSNR